MKALKDPWKDKKVIFYLSYNKDISEESRNDQ